MVCTFALARVLALFYKASQQTLVGPLIFGFIFDLFRHALAVLCQGPAAHSERDQMFLLETLERRIHGAPVGSQDDRPIAGRSGRDHRHDRTRARSRWVSLSSRLDGLLSDRGMTGIGTRDALDRDDVGAMEPSMRKCNGSKDKPRILPSQ